MSNLMNQAIEAHGGWSRWEEIRTIKAHIAVGGTVWPLKGWPTALADIDVSVDPHNEHVEYRPFLEMGQEGIFEPSRTSVVLDGQVQAESHSPRQSFAGHKPATPWDQTQLIYFAGYAMWTYLTTPFLLKLPGVQIEELAPWDEDGQTWRRLKATFPGRIHTHSTGQMFYFDESGLLRRHDYSVEIMGGTSSANYIYGYKSAGGLVFPERRRVYARGPDNRPLMDRLAVAIDFLNIEVS